MDSGGSSGSLTGRWETGTAAVEYSHSGGSSGSGGSSWGRGLATVIMTIEPDVTNLSAKDHYYKNDWTRVLWFDAFTFRENAPYPPLATNAQSAA